MLWDTGEQTTTHNTITYTKEPAWLEQALLPYDVLGSIAHVTMLSEQGYLSDEESHDIQEALNDLYTYDGSIDAEDVHTFIEEHVTQQTPAGKKMHAGRSRNDQVLVATRLYMKDASISVGLLAIDVIESLKAFAEENNELIPGYTHQQQAMPSSTGLWATSFADALIDDTELLKSTYDVFNCNPLGAAASYGTTLNIDRDKTTDLLDFPENQVNPIYCGNRGKQELMLLQALDHIMVDLQKLAEDIINFSEDQKIFEVPSEYCTGSSIMPQKENPDVLEIMRGKAEDVQAATNAVRNVIAKLPSGYNRDSQLTK